MNSRWSDADAQGKNDLDLLVYASRLIGAETTLVVWGGGNTSVKRDERDHRNRPTRVLRVKGSGSDLKSIQTKDFPGVRMDDVLALLERAGHGRPGDGGLPRPRAAGAREPAPVHRDPAPRLPARDGGDPHARRRGGLAHQQRPQPRRAARGLRRRRHPALVPAPRVPHLPGSRADLRGASEGARAAAREARDDLLGGHREGGLPRHDRADQPRGGGDRPSRPGPGALRRRRAREPARGGAAARGPRGGARTCAGWSGATGARSCSSTTRRTCWSSRPRARRRRSVRSGPPRRTTRSSPSGCRASRRSRTRRIPSRCAPG